MFSALNRKLFRDLLQMKGQSLAIGLVIACGVATFVMSLSTLLSLQYTLETYYERYRFADVFVQLKRAPNWVGQRIAEIPGVAQVQTRVVVEVNLDVPGMVEPAAGRIISIPEHPTVDLNALHLRAGRYIEPDREGEVLISEAFAEAHGLNPGDSVRAVINGRLETLRIVGVALSPEYVYQIRPGEILPDDRRFGVFWMGYPQLAPAFDMDGAFNDVALTLMPNAIEADVIARLDDITERYGGRGAYGREDHPSHEFVSNEIRELQGMAIIAPSIFLSVAAFLLNVVLTRLIGTQREQIATLKAFGYTRFEIASHYLKFVLLIVLLGVALGTGVGVWLGRGLTALYTRFFHFPVFEFRLEAWVVFVVLAISVGAGVAGTLNAVLRAMRLAPAQAMRPEPPANFRPTVIERLGLQRLVSPAARMILRQLERRPVKSALTSLGIAMAAAVLVLGAFMEDALDYAMETEFQLAQRQDLTVSFVEPLSGRVVHDLEHLPGVQRVEPFRVLAARLTFGHRSRRVGILGLSSQRDLFRLVDLDQQIVPLPPDGIVMSAKLAELLSARVGDWITVEVLQETRPVRRVPLTGLIDDFAGTSAYMSLDAMHRLMREQDAVSGAYLAADPNQIESLYRELKETPQVATVTVKQAMIRSFQETIAENILLFRTFNVIFACIIAFGVVYNSARIAMAERSRELATLRVIGFTRPEVSMILLGELATLTLIAMPFGLALGYSFAALMSLAFNTELFRIPLVVERSTYAFAATVVFIAAIMSALIVRRRIDELDLIGVLKTRE